MKTNDIVLLVGGILIVALLFMKPSPPAPDPDNPDVIEFPVPTGVFATVPDASPHVSGNEAAQLAWFWKNFAIQIRDDKEIDHVDMVRNMHVYAGKTLRRLVGEAAYSRELSEKFESFFTEVVGLDNVALDAVKRNQITDAFMAIAWSCNEAAGSYSKDVLVSSTPPICDPITGGCLTNDVELACYLAQLEVKESTNFFQQGPEGPEKPINITTDGLIYDKKESDQFKSQIPAFKSFGFDGFEAGDKRLLYQSVLKFDHGAFTERQETGDCFIAWRNALNLPGTKVRMSDGSEKAIEDVRPGEYVLNAHNELSEVVTSFKKPFSGTLYEIKLQGLVDPVVCTPDHKFLTSYKGEESWVTAEELSKNTPLLAPFASLPESSLIFDMRGLTLAYTNIGVRNVTPKAGHVRVKGGKHSLKRFVHVDRDLGWLLGIYLAEGGIRRDGDRLMGVDFSLHINEIGFANRIREIVKDKFDFDVTFYENPSKPSVRIVRLNSSLLGDFFATLCPGKIDSKHINTQLFSTSLETRRGILQGWLDGDGNINLGPRPRGHYLNVTGVSVSKPLVQDMQYLARTLAIHGAAYENAPSVNKWASSRRNRQSLQFRGQNALNVLPISSPVVPKPIPMSGYGLELKVSSIKTHEVEDIEVYCIEVPNHNSFIANGVAVHNCVSHATRNACDVSRAFEIDANRENESFVARGATEPIYGMRGHAGQGMTVVGSVRFVNENGGVLLRKQYGEYDLSKYTVSLGINWGRNRGGTPEYLKAEGRKNQIKRVAHISSVQEAADAIYNGYALTVGSNYSFSSTRDQHGIARRTPQGWAHAMAWVAVTTVEDLMSKEGLEKYLAEQPEDETEELEERRPRADDDPCFLIVNSWGKWNSGPEGKYDIPDGSFWITADNAAGMIRQDQAFALGNFDGFEPLPIDNWGFKPWLGTVDVKYNTKEPFYHALAP